MPFTQVEDTAFHHEERGDGPVALFIHGFPFDATMWIEQLDAAAPLRRCIAVDLTGFGRTGRTTRRVLTMEDHADDLAAFLDKNSVVTPIDVVGLSMGGYVALAFAQRHPDRVRSLGLVDTKSTADSEQARALRDVSAALAVREGAAALVIGMLDSLLAAEASPWIRARVRTMIETTPVETIVAALEGMKQRPDRTHVLAHTQVPVAVVVGEEDQLAPVAEAEHMAGTAPNGMLTVVPGAGHMAPIEQPDAVASALRPLFMSQ